MAKKPLPTPNELRQLLRYEANTGRLFWCARTPAMFKSGKVSAEGLCSRWNARNAGKEAFTFIGQNGYRSGAIRNRLLYAHRVIWAMINDDWPDQVDHINGDRADNRLCNLRAATQRLNSRNTAMSGRNTSGRTGVYWYKRHQKWTARIVTDREISLGYFDSFEDACAAREQAERKYGYSERHGS